MRYRRLGRTDISVSVVTMGCWAIVGDATWGAQDEAESLDTISAAIDAGINSFDTAEAYGDGYSEELLGKALVRRRDQVVIASKVSAAHLSAADVRESCQQSLTRLKTDYLDLYQIHWPSREIPIAETMAALGQLKDEGKIRAIGVSNFGPRDMDDVLAIGRCETNQLAYNLLFRPLEHEILPACIANDVGVLCYSPLAQGLLTGKFAEPGDVPHGRARTRHFHKARPSARHTEDGYEAKTFAAIERIRRICDRIGKPMAEVTLAWLVRRDGVASVIAGARRVDQVRQNALAADLELSDDVAAELGRATDDLKAAMGRNPDMWETDSRIR